MPTSAMKTKQVLPFDGTLVDHGQALQPAVWCIDLGLHSLARMLGATVATPASLVISSNGISFRNGITL